MAPFDNQRRIVSFLRKQGEASLAELSAGLGLSQVTVRHHLSTLMAAGIVPPPEKRVRPGPGRPELAFSLTGKAEQLLPEDYRDLAIALLGTLAARHGAEWVRRELREAGADMAARFGLTVARDQAGFMPQVLAGLEARGYLPAVGTWSGRRCITFANCPYLDAARASPAVCSLDQALLESLLGEPVVVFRQIAERDQQCIFLLGV